MLLNTVRGRQSKNPKSEVDFHATCPGRKEQSSPVEENTWDAETVQTAEIPASDKPSYADVVKRKQQFDEVYADPLPEKWIFCDYQKQIEGHKERLQKILIENNREIYNIPGDGNCFFNSVCHQVRCTNPDLDGSKLRNIICDHLVEQKDSYCLFIELKDDEPFESKIDAELRTSGRWNTALGDLLPLSMANLFQSRVEIFSSKEDSPYYMVAPDKSLPEHESRVKHHSSSIQLVYTAIPGQEHYDSCMEKKYNKVEKEDETDVRDDILYRRPPKKMLLCDSGIDLGDQSINHGCHTNKRLWRPWI